jgi:UDP-N-acetylenolpyruvoylglucosamine reductase
MNVEGRSIINNKVDVRSSYKTENLDLEPSNNDDFAYRTSKFTPAMMVGINTKLLNTKRTDDVSKASQDTLSVRLLKQPESPEPLGISKMRIISKPENVVKKSPNRF